jgi:hypothetical protein
LKTKPFRFAGTIMLSVLFVVTLFSLMGVIYAFDSSWKVFHAWCGGFLLIGSSMHFLTHLDRVKIVFTNFGKKQAARVRLNFIVEIVMVVLLTCCAVSGIIKLFLGPVQAGVWNHVHTISGLLMIIFIGLHLLLHAIWMSQTIHTWFNPFSLAD